MQVITNAIASIDAEIAQLSAARKALVSFNGTVAQEGAVEPKGKRRLSAAARGRIRAAQKARWRKFHKAQRKTA